jgi:hypothetical protein
VAGLCVVYALLRFAELQTGLPGLDERATGFGLGRLEPDQAAAIFGDSRWVLYVHNVIVALLSLAFAEPRNGTWQAVAAWLAGGLRPWMLVAVVASTAATAAIAHFVVGRARAWRARQFTDDDRLVILAVAVALGNAAMCYAYVKDEVMSVAGVFYALALYAALRTASRDWGRSRLSWMRTAVLSTVLLAASAGWALRASMLQYQLYATNFHTRYEWAQADEYLDAQGIRVDSPDAERLIQTLKTAALDAPLRNSQLVPLWIRRWFE